MTIQLKSIATTHPHHFAEQDEILAFFVAGRRSEIDVQEAASIYANAGIGRRYIARPTAWYGLEHSAAERHEVYLEAATDLFVRAATDALAGAGWAASDVDAVVSVSSSGIATPSIEAHVMPRMGFRPDAIRMPMFGLGCAGGIAGLGIAGRVAAASGGRVLLVCMELCSLSYRAIDSKASVIASALFGDGAAAVTVAAGEAAEQGRQGISVRGFHEHLWPETVDLMGSSVDALGLDVILSRDLPSFVHRQTAEVVDRAISVQGLQASDIARVVCHPGGTKVLSAVEAALGLPAGALDAERATLRKAGNMSSPTVFFVLKQVLEDGHHGSLMLTAFGPGFSVNFAAIDVEPGALGFGRDHQA